MQFLSQTAVEQARAAALAIDTAAAALISRDEVDAKLSDARYLITSVLMRASGVQELIRRADELTPVRFLDLRNRIHLAFGAPGDWGGDMEDALRALYAIEVPKEVPREQALACLGSAERLTKDAVDHVRDLPGSSQLTAPLATVISSLELIRDRIDQEL